MVNLEINVDPSQTQPTPTRARSVFAIGWVHYKSMLSGKANSTEDEMNVLGVMVVKDAVETIEKR